MNLEQFYDAVNGNYSDVKRRISKDSSIIKYLRMFIDDKEYGNLIKSFEKKDYRGVFAASHTLKGVCANLGLDALQKSSSEVCESVRNTDPKEDITPLVNAVTKDYENVMNALKHLEVNNWLK